MKKSFREIVKQIKPHTWDIPQHLADQINRELYIFTKTQDIKKPVYLKSLTTHQQLKTKGRVFLFRPEQNKTSSTYTRLTLGRKWVPVYPSGQKQSEAFLIWRKAIKLSELSDYVGESGFSSVDEWKAELKRLNGKLRDTGYIHLMVIP